MNELQRCCGKGTRQLQVRAPKRAFSKRSFTDAQNRKRVNWKESCESRDAHQKADSNFVVRAWLSNVLVYTGIPPPCVLIGMCICAGLPRMLGFHGTCFNLRKGSSFRMQQDKRKATSFLGMLLHCKRPSHYSQFDLILYDLHFSFHLNSCVSTKSQWTTGKVWGPRRQAASPSQLLQVLSGQVDAGCHF